MEPQPRIVSPSKSSLEERAIDRVASSAAVCSAELLISWPLSVCQDKALMLTLTLSLIN